MRVVILTVDHWIDTRGDSSSNICFSNRLLTISKMRDLSKFYYFSSFVFLYFPRAHTGRQTDRGTDTEWECEHSLGFVKKVNPSPVLKTKGEIHTPNTRTFEDERERRKSGLLLPFFFFISQSYTWPTLDTYIYVFGIGTGGRGFRRITACTLPFCRDPGKRKWFLFSSCFISLLPMMEFGVFFFLKVREFPLIL